MKVAAVTGANSGMGRSVALVLANSGMHVVMLCRNEKRGKEALSYIEQHKKNGSVELQLCDLGSLSSVKQAAKALKKRSTLQLMCLLIMLALSILSARKQKMVLKCKLV